VFQALSTDFSLTKTAGIAYQGKLQYRWQTQFSNEDFKVPVLAEQITSFGQLTWSLKGGDKEFLRTYFEVPALFATSSRPAFSARSGFLSSELSYFQSFRSGRASFYLGAALTDYAGSSNRKSPLHKSDLNVTYLVGLTYVLGESQRPSVPLEQTEGLINRFEKRLNLMP
jgi:outer membrane protein